jgi:hypothetical protein
VSACERLSLVFIWYLATGITKVSEIRKKPYLFVRWKTLIAASSLKDGGALSGVALFLAMKVIDGCTFEDRSVETARESPFVAIRIMARFAHRIVGDDVKNQIVWTVIDNLVRFTWGTEDSVAWYQFGQPFRCPDFASTGDNEIELRLSGVRVIRTRTRPGRYPAKL